jgi:hypothetical protein
VRCQGVRRAQIQIINKNKIKVNLLLFIYIIQEETISIVNIQLSQNIMTIRIDRRQQNNYATGTISAKMINDKREKKARER